jgi:heterodisulfide reductase subunit C
MSDSVSPFPQKEAELRSAFWDQVESFPDGDKVKLCLQCGTCTGSCPVSYAMDITPRQIVALFRAGMIEDILKSRAIWLCASCYSCTVRCPAGIKVTDTLYALKRIAMDRKIHPQRFPVHNLSKAFTDNVYKYGRNYELGLGLKYILKSNIVKLFPNAGFGLKMIKKHRLGLLPKSLTRIREIRAIINKANEFGEG